MSAIIDATDSTPPANTNDEDPTIEVVEEPPRDLRSARVLASELLKVRRVFRDDLRILDRRGHLLIDPTPLLKGTTKHVDIACDVLLMVKAIRLGWPGIHHLTPITTEELRLAEEAAEALLESCMVRAA